MALEAAFLVPHPPILIPEVGGSNSNIVARTNQSLAELARYMDERAFEHFFMTSPHLPAFDQYAIYCGLLDGDLGRFGAGEIKVSVSSPKNVCVALGNVAGAVNITARCIEPEKGKDFLDHGSVVPLWSLFGSKTVSVTPVSLAWNGDRQNHEFGKCLIQAAGLLNKKCALIVSGDLSHRLSESAPAGYNPRGKEFDDRIFEIISSGDLAAVMDIDRQLSNEAGHCALPGLQVMAGAMEGRTTACKVYSYEAPFGVGYMVAAAEVIN